MRRTPAYDPARDYYAILQIAPDASLDAIRRAYRQRVRELHPDRNPERADWATEQIKLVNEAYNVLRHPATRREYDRARWPFAPAAPAPPGTASSDLDPDLAWWEQVTVQSARQTAFDAAWETTQRAGPAPVWLAVSRWLSARGLYRLDQVWLALVGLWRSPYAEMLAVLAVALAINLAIIFYTLVRPSGQDMPSNPVGQAPPTALPVATTPTLDHLSTTCQGSGAVIHQPVSGERVGDAFMVFGTVDHPELWNYTVQISYLGGDPLATPADWIILRGPPFEQTAPEEPVSGDLLLDMPVMLSRSGYYALRVRVTLRDGTLLPPCDAVVLHE